MKYYTLVSISFLFTWVSSFAQKTSLDECKTQLHSVYQKMNAVKAPHGTVYFLDYTVTTTLPKRANEAGKEHVRAWLASDWSVTKGDRMEVWQDERDAFTVYPKEKKIVWGNSALGQAADIKTKKVLATRDSLFECSGVSDCEPISDKVNRVTLQLTERGKALLSIKEMEFELDAAAGKILKVIIRYVSGYRFQEMTTVFHTVDYDNNDFHLDKPLRNHFLTRKNVLMDQYKVYKLIDVRKKQ